MNRDRFAWRKYYMGEAMNQNQPRTAMDRNTERYKELICAVVKQTFLDLIKQIKRVDALRASINALQNNYYSVRDLRWKKDVLRHALAAAHHYEDSIRDLCREWCDLNAEMIIKRAHKYAKADFDFETFSESIMEVMELEESRQEDAYFVRRVEVL